MARELNIQKVRSMDLDELRGRIKTLDEELFNLRFRNAMRQLDNPVEIRNLRRDMAHKVQEASREIEQERARFAAVLRG